MRTGSGMNRSPSPWPTDDPVEAVLERRPTPATVTILDQEAAEVSSCQHHPFMSHDPEDGCIFRH